MGDRNDNGRSRSYSDNYSGKDLKFQNTQDQCSLKIENIADTDSYKDFEREIKNVGTTTKFWINKRSQTCIVTYSKQENAIDAMMKFSKMNWPNDKNGQKMYVKLIQNVEVSREITGIQRAQNISRPEQEKFINESRNVSNGGRYNDQHDKRSRRQDYSEERDRHHSKRDHHDRDRSPKQNDKYSKNNNRQGQSRSRSPPQHRRRDSPENYKRKESYDQDNRRDNQRQNNNNVYRTSGQSGVSFTKASQEVAEYRQKYINSHFDQPKN